jgi:hypothetical protein
MAKLTPEYRAVIWELKQRLLDIVDEAKAAEFNLLDSWGETDSTIIALEQLTEIAQQAVERFSQISILQIRIAQSQPAAGADLLRLLDERVNTIQNRVAALERSTQEIKSDWNLL